LTVEEDTPFCRVVEAGGAIAHQLETREDRLAGAAHPYLHHHNWLNGHIYARLYANGVCEVYAHHINSKSADDGLDLEDAVPVIGIRVEGAGAGPSLSEDVARVCGPWDGSVTELRLGATHFDLSEAARLATPDQPGSISEEGGFLVWQPYLGVELYAGGPAEERTGSPYVCRAEDRLIPRGMARTLRFSFSLSEARSARVARYIAPAWWYGVCEELQPRPLLPASNEYDRTLEACRKWTKEHIATGGFEDGSLPRYTVPGRRMPREPGWEGEIPYTMFLQAWRTGDAGLYGRAMRASYHFTDVAIDHAARSVRMHAFPPHAFALPMERVQAAVAAYLETGDPYLLDAAEGVVENAYRVHKNSWPRASVGRDASFIRGAAYLYRYFADGHYLKIARDTAADVAVSQLEDGSFAQQGGGVGIHGETAYIIKPWMGLMACGGLLDLLELGIDDARIRGAVRGFADWLMRERYEHEDGIVGWDYEHYHDGEPRTYSFATEEWRPLKTGKGLWNWDYLARFMMFCSLEFGDPAFFDAWAEVYEAGPEARDNDHTVAQSLQYIPWVQDRLWNARIVDGEVAVEPVFLGSRTPVEGVVQTPGGELELAWKPDGSGYSIRKGER